MRTGSSILVIADDPVARRDIPELALSHGWSCVLTDHDQIMQFELNAPESMSN